MGIILHVYPIQKCTILLICLNSPLLLYTDVGCEWNDKQNDIEAQETSLTSVRLHVLYLTMHVHVLIMLWLESMTS